jgi:hypothetical protein
VNLVGATAAETEPAAPASAEVSPALRVLSGGINGSVRGRRVWRISCGDVINRERCLTVLVEGNKVVLVGPPGETAVLNPGQLGQLRAALQEAAEQAEG